MRWKTGKTQIPIKCKRKGDEEDRCSDDGTALRETWKEWGKNGDQDQKIEGIGDC